LHSIAHVHAHAHAHATHATHAHAHPGKHSWRRLLLLLHHLLLNSQEKSLRINAQVGRNKPIANNHSGGKRGQTESTSVYLLLCNHLLLLKKKIKSKVSIGERAAIIMRQTRAWPHELRVKNKKSMMTMMQRKEMQEQSRTSILPTIPMEECGKGCVF